LGGVRSNLNWDAVGAIAELAGALGVIITLAYLAVQLRHNTATVRSNSATAHTQAVQASTIALTQDEETNKLFWKGLANRASLSPGDQRRFDGIVSCQLLTLEQAWRFREEGAIDDVAWQGTRASISWFAHTPGFLDYWSTWGSNHNPGFGTVVEEAIAEDLPAAVKSAVAFTLSADPTCSENA
jgi:hypothetical protein